MASGEVAIFFSIVFNINIMSRNDTFNIDDLLKMPDTISEFDRTMSFGGEEEDDIISHEALSINSLLNNEEVTATVHQKIDDAVNLEPSTPTTKVPPPPPPPIPAKPSTPTIKEDDLVIDMEMTPAHDEVVEDIDNLQMFEETAHSFLEPQVQADFDNLMALQEENQYYQNIEEEQDIKNDQQFTRIYFDDEKIEEELAHINPSYQPVNDGVESATAPVVEEPTSDTTKKNHKETRKAQRLLHKENLSQVAQFYRFEYRHAKIC